MIWLSPSPVDVWWETKGMHMSCLTLRIVTLLKQRGWVRPEEKGGVDGECLVVYGWGV